MATLDSPVVFAVCAVIAAFSAIVVSLDNSYFAVAPAMYAVCGTSANIGKVAAISTVVVAIVDASASSNPQVGLVIAAGAALTEMFFYS